MSIKQTPSSTKDRKTLHLTAQQQKKFCQLSRGKVVVKEAIIYILLLGVKFCQPLWEAKLVVSIKIIYGLSFGPAFSGNLASRHAIRRHSLLAFSFIIGQSLRIVNTCYSDAVLSSLPILTAKPHNFMWSQMMFSSIWRLRGQNNLTKVIRPESSPSGTHFGLELLS